MCSRLGVELSLELLSLLSRNELPSRLAASDITLESLQLGSVSTFPSFNHSQQSWPSLQRSLLSSQANYDVVGASSVPGSLSEQVSASLQMQSAFDLAGRPLNRFKGLLGRQLSSRNGQIWWDCPSNFFEFHFKSQTVALLTKQSNTQHLYLGVASTSPSAKRNPTDGPEETFCTMPLSRTSLSTACLVHQILHTTSLCSTSSYNVQIP